MAAAVLPMASSIHPAVSVLSSVGIRRGVMVLVLRAILVLGLLVRLALILVLGLSLAAEPVYLLSGRLAHPCLVPSRLRTALIILIVLVIINLCPFIVVHKNSPFTTKLIYRKFFDLLVYVREFTRDL